MVETWWKTAHIWLLLQWWRTLRPFQGVCKTERLHSSVPSPIWRGVSCFTLSLLSQQMNKLLVSFWYSPLWTQLCFQLPLSGFIATIWQCYPRPSKSKLCYQSRKWSQGIKNCKKISLKVTDQALLRLFTNSTRWLTLRHCFHCFKVFACGHSECIPQLELLKRDMKYLYRIMSDYLKTSNHTKFLYVHLPNDCSGACTLQKSFTSCKHAAVMVTAQWRQSTKKQGFISKRKLESVKPSEPVFTK